MLLILSFFEIRDDQDTATARRERTRTERAGAASRDTKSTSNQHVGAEIGVMSDKLNVLVTGGTGGLGRQVVMALRQSGHRARILSRHPKGHVDTVEGDLATGAGLKKAVAGMDA